MPCPEKFKETLVKYKVSEDIISEINKGYESVISKSPKKVKAAYFKRATDVLSKSIDNEKLQAIYEENACCRSGKRKKASQEFAAKYNELSVKDRIAHISEVPFMGVPQWTEDGTIVVTAVSQFDGKKYSCVCPNFNKSGFTEVVSKNYCFCCAGHFLYHYQIMLGVGLKTAEIISSPLDSDGKTPCVFRFSVM